MTKEFKHVGWGEAEQSRRGAQKSNREQASKKRLTNENEASISAEEEPVTQLQPKSEATGPVFYRCLSDPGDVKQRNPGEGVPFCRYCGFPMVLVGVGRERRERM